MHSTHQHSNSIPGFRRVLVAFVIVLLLGLLNSCWTPHGQTVMERPSLPATYAGAVRAYYQGYFHQSIAILKHLAASSPTDRRARWEIVRQYQEAGQYGKAAQVLRQLAQLSPGAGRAKEALFINLYLSGNLKSAGELLPLQTRSLHTMFYRALYELDSGRPAQAADILRR